MNKILLVFLLSNFICQSQSNYEKGSITKTNQETIHGFIKLNSDTEISFKSTMDADQINYNPASIESFTFAEPSRKFVSKTIKKPRKAYFFEYIVEGDVSLLYKDDNYYLYSIDNDINLLEIKKTSGSNAKGLYESSISTYKGVLSYYAKDCAILQKKANSTKYTRRKLADFVVELNKCQNSTSQNFNETSRTNLIEIGVTTGANFANFERTGIQPYKTSGGEFGLNLGGFVSFSPDVKRFNLSFQLGIEYNQKKNDYSYKTTNLLFERRIVTDAAVIEPYVSLLYQPFYNNNGLFSPYIGLGSSYGLRLKHEVRITDPLTDEFYELQNDQSIAFIYRIGTFIQLKSHKFLFELNFSDYNYQESGFVEEFGNNIQFKVGYIYRIK